jgi:glycine/D-amino acid oxidase-like deaminating enzyme
VIRRNISLRFPDWRSVAGSPPMRSLWVNQALARENGEPVQMLDRTIRKDVCIVGGGFTGLWTAIRLRERDPAVSVCIVEADLCGTGASGRNSGAAGPWWPRAAAILAQYGDVGAREVLRASELAVADIWSFVKQQAVDCEIRHGRSVWSSNVPGGIQPWESVFRSADRLQLAPPFRRLTTDELGDLSRTGPYFGGVVDDAATRVQPALLARALRRRAVELGCDVFERSPVARIESAAEYVKVQTNAGMVEAQQVVLAANAWMAHLDEFRSRIHTTSSDIVVTEPIPERLGEEGLSERPGGINTRQMVNYWGHTPDGRIYFGRGGGALTYGSRISPEYHWSAARAREVEEDFHLLYPKLANISAKHSWGGPIDRSTNGLPMFGRLRDDDRVSYGIGYSGHGVAATSLGGRILSSLILHQQDEWSALSKRLAAGQKRQFPPEPARYMIGSLVRNAVARKERSELSGKPSGPIDRALSKLATVTLPAKPLIRTEHLSSTKVEIHKKD